MVTVGGLILQRKFYDFGFFDVKKEGNKLDFSGRGNMSFRMTQRS
jgi:hypothetical protein